MRVRNLCLLFVLLLLGGLICEPTPTPTPAPTTTPAPTPLPSPTPRPPVTLRWNLGAEPQSIDPALASSDAEVDVARQLFVGLTAYDPQTSEPIPDLATHWEIGDSGQVYTFHLRADVHWVHYDADAARVEVLRPVTAHDVVYSLRRAIAHSDTAYVLDIIQNAKAINTASDTYDVEALGVTAVGDHTVRFTLERSAAYLPAILALPVAWPVPREVVEAHGEQWTEPVYIVTNGAYVLVDWQHDRKLMLAKNPLYYGASGVQIDRITCAVVSESSTALALYANEEFDTLCISSQFLRSQFRSRIPPLDPGLSRQLDLVAQPCTYYYVFNTHKPPLDNVHVRRAFSYAIDRQTLVAAVLQDGSRPASILAPPGIWGSAADDPGVGIVFDPQKAQQELALAGYPQGLGFPKISVRYGYCDEQFEDEKEVTLAVVQMWREYLSVDVEIVCRDPWLTLYGCPDSICCKDLIATLPHVELRRWRSSDYPDQHDFIYWVSQGEWERRSRCNLWLLADEAQMQKLWQLLTAAGKEFSPGEREAMYREAEQFLCADACAVAPVFHTSQIWLTKPYLHRDYPAVGGQNFKDWRIDPH